MWMQRKQHSTKHMLHCFDIVHVMSLSYICVAYLQHNALWMSIEFNKKNQLDENIGKSCVDVLIMQLRCLISWSGVAKMLSSLVEHHFGLPASCAVPCHTGNYHGELDFQNIHQFGVCFHASRQAHKLSLLIMMRELPKHFVFVFAFQHWQGGLIFRRPYIVHLLHQRTLKQAQSPITTAHKAQIRILCVWRSICVAMILLTTHLTPYDPIIYPCASDCTEHVPIFRKQGIFFFQIFLPLYI